METSFGENQMHMAKLIPFNRSLKKSNTATGMMQHMRQDLEAEARGSHSDAQGGHGRGGRQLHRNLQNKGPLGGCKLALLNLHTEPARISKQVRREGPDAESYWETPSNSCPRAGHR